MGVGARTQPPPREYTRRQKGGAPGHFEQLSDRQLFLQNVRQARTQKVSRGGADPLSRWVEWECAMAALLPRLLARGACLSDEERVRLACGRRNGQR
jgi:hypothetical protein